MYVKIKIVISLRCIVKLFLIECKYTKDFIVYYKLYFFIISQTPGLSFSKISSKINNFLYKIIVFDILFCSSKMSHPFCECK